MNKITAVRKCEEGNIGWWLLDEMFAVAFFLLSLMTCQPGVAIQEKVNWRVSRAVQSSTPTAVSCQLGNWGEWTDCFPCQEKKYRYRSLLQPNKFGGTICSGTVWDQASCHSPTVCVKQAQCGQDFQCKETGRCLKRHLVCNGDKDCLDGSDEDNCEDVRVLEDDCSQYDPIPGSERVTSGYNFLTQKEAQSVYDVRYYGGQCETVYNGEWRELRYDSTCERLYYGDDEKYFRKPYNFLKYHFEALADTTVSSELYDDANDLFTKVKNDKSVSAGVTIGVSPAGSPFTATAGVSGSRDSSFLNKLSKYNQKVLKHNARVTQYSIIYAEHMRRENIMLDEVMLQSLMELPEQYNYGMYAKFIDDYGTHYITSGTMGGIYEYILVLNKERMETAGVTSNDIKTCFGSSFGIDYDYTDTTQIGGRLSGEACKKFGGGKTGKFQALDKDLSKSWDERNVQMEPGKPTVEIKSHELQPIHEILRHTNLGPLETKRQNLRRALDQYLMEFNACRCGPCFNNGKPILD
ncbi:hypothetical protein E2I00_013053, partial [Balaenoptera physalus]